MARKEHAASVAEVDLAALDENLRQVRKRIGRKKILAVVKANAYGHGAVEIARFLEGKESGRPPKVAMFAVAFLEEGQALRKAGIDLPILLMTGCPIEQVPEIVRYRLTPLLFDLESLFALSRHARKIGKKINVHIKLDTGMGRLGLPPNEALAFIQRAVDEEGIRVEGLLTHFAEADLKDLSFARGQLEKLKDVWIGLQREGIKIPYCHLANSAAIMHFGPAHFNLVRPGLMLYGYSPLEGKTTIPLRPVMQVRTRVIAMRKVPAGTAISYGRTFVTRKESLIATLSIGYADGYPRLLSNRGMMIAKGRRVPVVGRVCMDMTMIDVTEVPSLKVGDRVTVIGAEGEEAIWADELARGADTIPYEIICGIGDRIPRIYTNLPG
jgi:alanine racemase